MTLPVIMTKDGATPTAPSVIRGKLVTLVAETNPGYTANLPGSLIEDIASTDTGGIYLCDSARVELINSLTPYGANEFLLNQLGQIYGVMLGQETNTSVYVQFFGLPGFIISKGFIVSDGEHQYVVMDGGILDILGYVTLFAVAVNAGSWAVPANSVTQLITSVPSAISLSVTNPTAGTPSTSAETQENYRARVLQAGLAASQGMATYLRTLLNNVTGVQSRLISIRQAGGNWQIIVGGGDPYSVGYAIYSALFDINHIVGSAHSERNITVTLNNYPDKYNITFVNPVNQSVNLNVSWNTTLTNFISDQSVATLAKNALYTYINSLYCGDAINVIEMQTAFQLAVADIIPAQYISKIDFQVYIDSILTAPDTGTGLIFGDPEGYFYIITTNINVVRG